MSDELEVFCEGIADAIRTKKETSATINAQNFREEILSIKSGVELNGLIKEYKLQAGENISAGDFVEYLNNVYKSLTTDTYSCYFAPSAVLLEENKVFIAHSHSSNYYLNGTIVEINGTEMTTITRRLNSTQYSCYLAPSCCLLEPNKVFIAHSYSNNKYLYGTIVEINGTTMTATTTRLAELNLPENCYHAPSCILLENNKVFIAHSYNRRLYGTIVEIDGTTMAPTFTELNSTQYSCYLAPSCCLLEPNKVFIAHSYDDNRHLCGTIVEINGTTMTATSTELDSSLYSCYEAPSCCLLEQNKVFIAHSYDDNHFFYGTIVEINGTTMTATSTELMYNKNTSCKYAPSCCLLEPNKVFIAHSYGYDNRFLYGTIVEINGTEMTTITIELNPTKSSCEDAPSCILLENNKVFIAHKHGPYARLYGTIPVGDGVKPYETKIFGVAKTGGVPGDTIQVYVPNEE